MRLLTLTGPGGVGKTRLALRIGEELHDSFVGDVYFVSLAVVAEPDLFVPTVGSSLGLREGAGRPMSGMIAEALRERRTLLILDNLEHLKAATPVLARWLEACPRLTILATSRAMLHLSGERVYPVGPLPVPDVVTAESTLQDIAGVDAVRLLLERAQAVQPDVTLSSGNMEAAAQICQAVDGLPLAIELAAPRLRVLSPGELLAALGRQIEVLSDGPHDLPARLRTMRNAIAWSVDRLADEERVMFRVLGAFTGGFTLEAVDWVRRAAAENEPSTPNRPNTTVDLIAVLADQSLVQRIDRENDPPGFRLLEPIRAYAIEELVAEGELDAIRECLARWCLAFAERAEPELSGEDQKSGSSVSMRSCQTCEPRCSGSASRGC